MVTLYGRTRKRCLRVKHLARINRALVVFSACYHRSVAGVQFQPAGPMHTPAMMKSVAGKYQLYRCILRPAFVVIILISLYIVCTNEYMQLTHSHPQTRFGLIKDFVDLPVMIVPHMV